MIHRETDLSLINRVANSGGVKPFIDYRDSNEPLDFAPAVGRITQTGIVWLSNGDDAVSCFALTAERTYQVHIMFADTCRGARAIEIATAMLTHMRPFADTIWGAVPMVNRKARWFAKRVGFRSVGFDEYETEGPVELLVLGSVH